MADLRPLLGLLLVLSACPEPEPEPEPTPPPLTETEFAGVVVDQANGTPLGECLVGTDPGTAIETDDDGRFSVVVPLGSTVHVACELRPVWSAVLAEVAATDWRIEVDGDPVPTDACSPSITIDATGVVPGPGGAMEIRILNATDTASLTGAFYAEQTIGAGVFSVPPGDYTVLARAFGGALAAGFGIAPTMTCVGGESDQVTVVVEETSTEELGGTWTASSSDVDFFVSATQKLDSADFGWWDQNVTHRYSGNPVGWSLTIADAIGAGALDVEGCQGRLGQRGCRGRLDVGSGTDLDLGELVEPVDGEATIGELVTVSLPFDIDAGYMTVRMDDLTDPFDQRTVWRGVTPSNEISVPAAWFADGLAGTDYGFRIFGIDGAEVDWAAAFEPHGFVDGYAYQAPGLLQIEN